MGEDLDPRIFPDKLTAIKPDLAAPEFIVDLARIEWALHQAKTEAAAFQRQIDKLTVNPTLVLIPVSWKNLAAVIETKPGEDPEVHESSDVHVIVWRHPKSGKIHIRETEDIDLLALKITVEEIPGGRRHWRCAGRCDRICKTPRHTTGLSPVTRISDSSRCFGFSRNTLGT